MNDLAATAQRELGIPKCSVLIGVQCGSRLSLQTPLCLCLWLSGQRWLLHGGPGVAQGQDRAGLGGRLAGSADLLAVFLWCRPCLRAHSQGLAKWALASASPGQEGDEDSWGGANFVPGTLHSIGGSQETDPMASFFLCKLILIEREIIPFQKFKF